MGLVSHQAKKLWGGVPQNMREAAMQANTPEKQAFVITTIYNCFIPHAITYRYYEPYTKRSCMEKDRDECIRKLRALFPPLNHREQA